MYEDADILPFSGIGPLALEKPHPVPAEDGPICADEVII
jgi:hypothetical protein